MPTHPEQFKYGRVRLIKQWHLNFLKCQANQPENSLKPPKIPSGRLCNVRPFNFNSFHDMTNFHPSVDMCTTNGRQLKVTKILILSQRRYEKQSGMENWRNRDRKRRQMVDNKFCMRLSPFPEASIFLADFFPSTRSIEPHCPNRRARFMSVCENLFPHSFNFFAPSLHRRVSMSWLEVLWISN